MRKRISRIGLQTLPAKRRNPKTLKPNLLKCVGSSWAIPRTLPDLNPVLNLNLMRHPGYQGWTSRPMKKVNWMVGCGVRTILVKHNRLHNRSHLTVHRPLIRQGKHRIGCIQWLRMGGQDSMIPGTMQTSLFLLQMRRIGCAHWMLKMLRPKPGPFRRLLLRRLFLRIHPIG